MAKTFREMVAWQLAFELKEKVVALLAVSPPALRDFAFRDQLTDAVKSVPSNLAEGFGRYRPRQTAQFVEVALGSLDETENHLRDGVGSGYFTAESVGPLIRLAARCRTASTRWLSYLRKAKRDGPPTKRRKNPRVEPP
jgi:four helix bundle protein